MSMYVMMVEDDEYISRVYERAFRLSGHTIAFAPDASIALDYLQKPPPPDAIILDVVMPMMRGDQLLKILKSDPRYKDIPVIILTNSVHAEKGPEYIAMGASEYLIKIEYTPKQVLAKLETLIQMSRKNSGVVSRPPTPAQTASTMRHIASEEPESSVGDTARPLPSPKMVSPATENAVADEPAPAPTMQTMRETPASSVKKAAASPRPVPPPTLKNTLAEALGEKGGLSSAVPPVGPAPSPAPIDATDTVPENLIDAETSAAETVSAELSEPPAPPQTHTEEGFEARLTETNPSTGGSPVAQPAPVEKAPFTIGPAETPVSRDRVGAMIFVAEDDPLMGRMYQRALKIGGYDIEFATDGEAALLALQNMKQKPSLILLDVMMPKLSGFDVLRKLKADEVLKDVPVVMLTNLAGQSDAEKGIELGAKLYLVKSQYSPKQLVEKIDELLKH